MLALRSVSYATVTVLLMEFDDVVDPGDTALQALLASIAEHTSDAAKRDKLLDILLTVPPMSQWPNDLLEHMQATCRFVIDLSRELRKRCPDQRPRTAGVRLSPGNHVQEP
jgi:hypothetical protein